MDPSKVSCEICGIYNVSLDNPDMVQLALTLGVFPCDRCVTSWAILERQFSTIMLEAQQQEDIEKIGEIKNFLEQLALKNLLKNNPLPTVLEEVQPKNRMDTIIMGEDCGE